MKKFIAGLSALALAGMITMSVSADTTIAPDPDNMPAPKPGSAGLEVSYDVSPTYTVTIPAAVELSPTETQTKNITATDVKLEQGAKIVVTLDSASNTESGSTFNAKIGDSTANYTISAGGANVEVGGKVAEFDTKDGDQSAALTFSKAEGATYAGKHTEQLTFGIAVETAPTTVDVESISLNNTSLELTAGGDTATLTATVSPDNATVTWTSSNTSVATVDNNGVVTTVGAGTAIITATAGGKTATCNVTVKEAVKLIKAFENGAVTNVVVKTKSGLYNYNVQGTFNGSNFESVTTGGYMKGVIENATMTKDGNNIVVRIECIVSTYGTITLTFNAANDTYTVNATGTAPNAPTSFDSITVNGETISVSAS